MHRDVLDQGLEVGGLGHEVGLAVDLDEHADLGPRVDVGADDAFAGGAARLLGGRGQALLAQEVARASRCRRSPRPAPTCSPSCRRRSPRGACAPFPPKCSCHSSSVAIQKSPRGRGSAAPGTSLGRGAGAPRPSGTRRWPSAASWAGDARRVVFALVRALVGGAVSAARASRMPRPASTASATRPAKSLIARRASSLPGIT